MMASRPEPASSPSAPSTLTVLGAGSWGTALAIHLSRNGHRVRLWGRDPAAMAAMASATCNTRYLPDIPFPDSLEPTADLGAAMAGSDGCLVVVPSHAFSATLDQLAPHLGAAPALAWATKGLDPDTLQLPHEQVRTRFPDATTAVVSGPTFASEVARGRPTAVTVAASCEGFAAEWVARLHGPTFRAYSCSDIPGVELGGAVKNVLAIATGIADGLQLGANTRAALITRGLAESMRLGTAIGAQRETFMGLAGLGDLVLTCTDDQSRNRRFGLAIGRGQSAAEARSGIDQVVEGEPTCHALHRVARNHGVEMPLVDAVHQVLFEGLSPEAAAAALLAREPRAES